MRKFLIFLLEPVNRWFWAWQVRNGLILFCSDAPDNSGMNAAAVQQAALSAEQLAWAKQVYADTAPDRAAAAARAAQVSDAQLESMNTQTDLAKDYSDYQKNTFRPLEQGIVADAAGYDTPERRAAAAGQAMADVGTQADAARETMAREAMARGVDPSSGNFAATQGAFGVRAAAAKAAAGNAASTQVETIGQARKMDAANLGRGLASNQATSAGLALTAGNNSTANAQVPLQVAQGGANLMNQGYSGAQQGLSGAASTYGAIANANKSDDSGAWGALGSLGGAALMAFSDENMKENIEPVDPEKALEQVEGTPVKTFNYEAGTPGAEDAGTGPTVGPMAQDVKKTMGPKVAPKGKKIDLIAMNGITMAALQGLSKKVDRIAAAAGLPA